MPLVTREDRGRVAVLTLQNPPANGYSHAMHRELDALVVELRFDGGIDVVVLRGAGDKFFCGGADITYLQSLTPEEKYAFCLHANETLLRVENTPKLFIAALNGHCVGGGLEVALACDLRVGRAGGGVMGLPEVGLGVLPGTGGTQRLTRVLGRARALQLMVEGQNFPVEHALSLGLIHKLLPAEGWWDAVLAWADSFTRPGKAAGAVGLIKRSVLGGADLPLEAGLALERELQMRLFAAPDAGEGLAAFLEKRSPHFSAAAPSAAPAARPHPSPPPTSPAPASAPSTAPRESAAAALARTPAVRPAPEAFGGSASPPPPAREPHAGPSSARFDLSRTRLQEAALNRLGRDVVERCFCVPVRLEGDALVVAFANPRDGAALAAVEAEAGMPIIAVAADEMDIAAAIGQHYRA
jgi:enoyl-CoA hydratase/carnithine racemase